VRENAYSQGYLSRLPLVSFPAGALLPVAQHQSPQSHVMGYQNKEGTALCDYKSVTISGNGEGTYFDVESF
jgi:hypothetical protein